MLARSVRYSSTNFATLANFLAPTARTTITRGAHGGASTKTTDQDKDVVETMSESNHLLQLQGMIQRYIFVNLAVGDLPKLNSF